MDWAKTTPANPEAEIKSVLRADLMMKLRHNAGFTLLEVMIAMAILAIMLVGVFQLQSQSISMSIDSRFKTTAALLAQSKMVDAESGLTLSNRTENGDFGPDYPQYNWQMEVTDTQIPRFKKIEVTVANNVFARGGVYKLVFYKTVGN